MNAERLGLRPALLRFLQEMHRAPRLRGLRLAFAGWHFYVDAVSIVHDHIWDTTSLILRKAIRREVCDGDRVLDMGTGHLGLLAIYCARTHDVRVTAVDVNPEFIENAQIVAHASDAASIEFRVSNWFSNVDGTFDLIFGNVPYVPTKVGTASDHVHTYPEIWDGGNDGLEHARAVLPDVGDHLKPEGRLLLGIDTGYIPRSATLALVAASRDLELRRIIKSWVSASEVYVIGHKTHAPPDC
ncbi:MAG: class I SAM-dependent methyltransferase [Pseudomonadota bacterium]